VIILSRRDFGAFCASDSNVAQLKARPSALVLWLAVIDKQTVAPASDLENLYSEYASRRRLRQTRRMRGGWG
jgi:hypothetical protein